MRESLVSVRKPAGSTGGIGVVELDLQGAACVPDRNRLIQPPVLEAQVVEHAQRLPGEPAQLVMVAFGLQLADHHQRQDHLVLVEPGAGPRIGQQHGGVEDVGTSSHVDSYVGAAPAPTGCFR